MAHCVRCLEAISDHRLYGRICGCFPGVPNDKEQPAIMSELIVSQSHAPFHEAYNFDWTQSPPKPMGTPCRGREGVRSRIDNDAASRKAMRARLIREALADLAIIVANDPGSHVGVYTALAMLAEFADDATLDRLARMVR